MQRKIVKTADGSTTIQLPEWNEQYHSMHGAVQEAKHVFLKMGLDLALEQKESGDQLSVLEMGFGTGLNAILTCIAVVEEAVEIRYEGVEAYPVAPEEVAQLNYIELLDAKNFIEAFSKMHETSWEEEHRITENFVLTKRKQRFETISDKERFDLIYFDAFGARVQPELWEKVIFQKMYDALKAEGILVTYSAKGSVRRAMQDVGFRVEKLPGPPGKREMLRAIKTAHKSA